MNSGGAFRLALLRPLYSQTRSSEGPPSSYRSASDGVPQNDHAAAEPALADQLQLQPHTIREEPFCGADDQQADDHLKLVDKTSL